MLDRLINIFNLIGLNRVIKALLRFLADKGIVWPFVVLYGMVIREIVPEGKSVSKDKITLLALNCERFNDELDILAGTGEFRILKLPFNWQIKALNIFWPSKIPWKWKDYFNPDADNNMDLIELQINLRKFLRKMLMSLYKKLGIDCVIGATFYYKQDYDWGIVSNEIGVPYIVIQYDRIFGGENKQPFVERIVRSRKKFKGSHIIVSNGYSRDTLITEGYVEPEKISSLGLIRMDDFVRKVILMRNAPNSNNRKKSRKKVTLFSFLPSVGLRAMFGLKTFPDDPNVGYQRLFENVHTSIARLAVRHKDIDFVIKTKWGGIWFNGIKKACRKNGFEINSIPNLLVTDNIDSHQLIYDSDVVCGFSSTALLEAGIAAKPVIVPLFDEALKPEYQKLIGFFDCYHLFDCAGSAVEFENLIIERVGNQGTKVNGEFIKMRDEMFEKHVSSIEGVSLKRYIEKIKHVVEDTSRQKGRLDIRQSVDSGCPR